jgi:hypothetical protein
VKPGKVKGPIKVTPKKRSDLTDYRRAKRLQDFLNWQLRPSPEGTDSK